MKETTAVDRGIGISLRLGLSLALLNGCFVFPWDTRGQSLRESDANSPVIGQASEEPTLRYVHYKMTEDDIHSPVFASEKIALEENGSQSERGESVVPDETLFSWDYLKSIGLDIKETFTAPARWKARDWIVFSGVSAGIATVAVFDKDIQQAVQRNRNSTTDQLFDTIRPFGAEYSFAMLGGFYLGGEFFHDVRAKSVALDGLTASLIASGLIVQPLKIIIGRDRPTEMNGPRNFEPFGGDQSFPSGETTQAFAVASVISQHYDSIWVSCASYGMAGLVGYSRMNANAHWASDVLVGAAIGTFVGHVVVHFNEHRRHASLMPIIGPQMQGVQLSWSF